MRKLLLLGLLCFALNALGQNAQHEINNQVWKPFIKTFSERDSKAFMDLHAQDLVRSSRDSKTILNWREYAKQTESWDQKEKGSGSKRLIELRFTERIASSDRAIEVGIYKTTYIQKDGNSRSFFGRFHVVLRKDDGTWKILVDTDSSENNSIAEKDFVAAAPLE